MFDRLTGLWRYSEGAKLVAQYSLQILPVPGPVGILESCAWEMQWVFEKPQ